MPSTPTDRLAGLTTSVAVKAPCRLATTANITLSGLQTIDSVLTVQGDRILVKGQADAAENGIYNANSGAWERALDFNGSLDAVGGTQVSVTSGTAGADTYWRVVGNGGIEIGTDDIEFEPGGPSAAAAISYTFPDSDAEQRSVADKLDETVSLFDFIPEALHDSIRNNTCETNLSAYFDEAFAYIDSLTAGGEIYLPPGTYVMDMDCSTEAFDFTRRTRVRGAGRNVTRVFPVGSGSIVLNLLGRSFFEAMDLTIKAGASVLTPAGSYAGYAAACGIYLCREDSSTNCNNNKFINVAVEGNFTAHGVVSCGAESSLWLNCQFKPSAGSFSAFWTGTDPSLCGVTVPAGTPSTGPNSDNRSIGCEFYVPFNGARPLTISRSGGWTFIGAGIIVGNATNVHLVTFKDPDGGSFNGPIQFRDCQYEVFGANNSVFYLEATGSTAWYGIHTSGGYAVIDNNTVFLDYDRTAIANKPALGGCVFEMPQVPSGDILADPISTGLPIYCYSMTDCRMHWRNRDGNGLIVVFGFVARSFIDALETRIVQLVLCDAPLYLGAVPTTGTYAKGQRVHRSPDSSVAAGEPDAWICSTAGTLGTLNGGATTANTSHTLNMNRITVNSATGLKIGQKISIAGDTVHYIMAISGTTVYLDTDCVATLTGAAVSFSNGAFLLVGIIGGVQILAQADTVAADLAALKVDFNALLAKMRTSKLLAT